MEEAKYQLLRPEESALSDSLPERYHREQHGDRWRGVSIPCLCALSLLLNILFVAIQFFRVPSSDNEILGFSSIPRDIEIPWTHEGPYWNDNNDDEESMRQMWEEIDISAGTVALTDEYAESKGLPRSQRFPWDEDKGVYILNAWHALHCLKRLHTSILEAKNGRPQSRPWGHTLHCIDALRQDTMCYADDTPRYTGQGSPLGTSGINQYRKCKDWSKVERWAEEHTACWRYVNGSDPTTDTLERYKYCPPDSPYNEWIYEVFGTPDQWLSSSY